MSEIVLAGTIRFQALSDAGLLLPEQQLAVRIGVDVVESHSTVRHVDSQNWPWQDRFALWEDMSVAAKVLAILAMPFLALLEPVVCFLSGEDCRC